MNQRLLGISIIAAGLVLAAVGLLANPLGLGESARAEDEFGWKQTTALVVGLVLVVVGVVVERMARRRRTGA